MCVDICGARARCVSLRGWGSGPVGGPWFWILLLSVMVLNVTSSTLARVNMKGFTEYCDTDTFRARCNPGEVIVMESAKYGRMKFGKCVDKDWGYLGCQTDVMLLADRWCSGRRSCQIPIPNSPFKSLSRCPKDLNDYFEAAFACMKVETAQSQSCMTSKYILPSSEHSGVLANYLTTETKKGSEDCPWVIQARLGQRVNITLMDFSRPNTDPIQGNGPAYDVCHVYAVITESTSSHKVNPHTVCGGGRDREKIVYVSKGHSLEVRVIAALSGIDDQRYFLLKYEVFGCETPKPLPNTWIRRKDEDNILIGCESGGNLVWHAECINNMWHWDDTVGNCTEVAAVDVGFVEFLLNVFALPLEYTLVVVIIIALAILIVTVLLSVCCIKVICPKKKKPQQQQPPTTNGRHRHYSERSHDKTKPVQAVQPTTKPTAVKQEVPDPQQQSAERHAEMEQGQLGHLPPPPAFLMELSEKEEKDCDTDEEEMPPPPISPTDNWLIKPPPNRDLPPTPGRSPQRAPPSYSQLFEDTSLRWETSGQFDNGEKVRHVKGHRRMPSDVTLSLQRSPRGHKQHSRNQVPLSADCQTNPHNSFEFPPPPKEFMRQTSEPAQEKPRVRFQDLPDGYKRRDKRLSSDPLRNHIVRDPGQMSKHQQQNPTGNQRQKGQVGQVKPPQSYGSFSRQILNARPPTEATLTFDNSMLQGGPPPHRNEQTYFELEPESPVPYEMGYSVKTGKKFKVYHSDSHEKEKKLLNALESSPGKKKGISNNTM